MCLNLAKKVTLNIGKAFYLLLGGIMLSACSVTRVVEPLPQGAQEVQFSLGGPLIHLFGTTIPTPLTSLSYNYGYKENLTLSGGLNLTSLAFGVIHLDIGATYGLWRDSLSTGYAGVSIRPSFYLTTDVYQWQTRFFPQLDLMIYYKLNKHLLYTGLVNFFELKRTRAHNLTQPKLWFWNPTLGYQYEAKHWRWQVEVRWLAPDVRSDYRVPDYVQPFGKPNGTLGLYIGITRKLNW